MSWLRHASRHVHHTVANYIEHHLAALDWTDPQATPFGAAPVKIMREPVLFGDERDRKIQDGTVAITIGDEDDVDHKKLGGPLVAQEYPLFVDIFAAQEGVALALANDVRDILKGRLPGTQRWHDLINQSNGNVVPGWKLEFEAVYRERPENQPALRWQVVKAEVVAYFPEVTY